MPTTTTRPVPARAAGPRPRRRLRGSRTLNFWLFTGPFLLGLAVFVYVPIGWSLYLSFFEAR
ncbi:sugar ABC transporter permease, partial [Streptomyces achromogenes]